MRYFALMTAGVLAALAVFTVLMPSTDRYVPGVDDGPIQRFTSITEAEKAVGSHLPNAGTPPGWTLQTIVVAPAYHGRHLLSEQPDLLNRRTSLREAVESGRIKTMPLRFWLADSLPDPPPGVHNYIVLMYVSENGVIISLEPRQWAAVFDPPPPIQDVTDKTTRMVRIGPEPAKLTTYTSRSSEAMIADWRIDGVPLKATAFNESTNPRYRITADDFIDFLTKVH